MEPNNLSKEISETLGTPAPIQSTIRTMKGDVSLAIQKQQETLVSIAMAEEKKKEARRQELLIAAEERAQRQESSPKPRGRMFLIVILLILIIAGVLGYFFVLPRLSTFNFSSLMPSATPTPVVIPAPIVPAVPRVTLTPAILPTQAETIFSLKQVAPAQIFARIKNDRISGDVSWEIKNIIITDEVTQPDGSTKTIAISMNRLATLAGLTMPEILARSLQNTSMTGFILESGSTIPTPFMILKVSGYGPALNGMLQWEQNLPTLFDTVFGTNITAGLSPKTKTKDVSILGHDSRVLEITPNVGIAYTFANQSTLVITGSRTALEKIIPMVAR